MSSRRDAPTRVRGLHTTKARSTSWRRVLWGMPSSPAAPWWNVSWRRWVSTFPSARARSSARCASTSGERSWRAHRSSPPVRSTSPALPVARAGISSERRTTCGDGLREPEAMIVTVTLNAALDRTLTVPNFQRGQRHRASGGLTLAGGKGINVARALKRLDVPVVATGLVGGLTGTRLVEQLTGEAILNDFVRIADESRTSTAVVDPTASSYTEINEWGPHVEPEELAMLLEKIAYLSRGADMVVFAGTLPRGVEDSFYAEAIRDLHRRNVRTVLDSEGQPLRLGAESEPFLVSPNQSEAEGLVGNEFRDQEDST